MYNSPISMTQKITDDIKHSVDDTVYKAVLEAGVSVDKQELVKALKYDREQYNAGYIDGLKAFEASYSSSYVASDVDSKEWFEKRLARAQRRLALVSRKPNTPAEEIQGLRDKEKAYKDALAAITYEARMRAYIKHLEERCGKNG